jgi:hypothetical protein
LELNESGDIVRTSSTMRKLRRHGEWRSTPWGGEFGDYAQIGPLCLPTTGQAYWELETGRFVYWRGNITTANLVGEPFRR